MIKTGGNTVEYCSWKSVLLADDERQADSSWSSKSQSRFVRNVSWHQICSMLRCIMHSLCVHYEVKVVVLTHIVQV